MATSTQDWIEELKGISVLELAERIKALEEEFPQRDIDIRPGDANAHLTELLGRGLNWRANKGVVFLDPFGMHVPWSTVAAIAKIQDRMK